MDLVNMIHHAEGENGRFAFPIPIYSHIICIIIVSIPVSGAIGVYDASFSTYCVGIDDFGFVCW